MATSLPATAIAAGVKTPGSGAYADPARVGAMIQQMYPQYASMDATTLGQRWIDVHTPQQIASTGTTDTLQAPGTTPTTTTNPNTPDLSGLSAFAQPVQQLSQGNQSQPAAPLVGGGGQGGGAALAAPKLAPTPKQTYGPIKPTQFTQLPKGLSMNL